MSGLVPPSGSVKWISSVKFGCVVYLLLCVSQFDSNGDGQISLTELREAMKKLMGEQVTNREINEILQDVDLNGDGLVDFEGERNFLCLYGISSSSSSSSLSLFALVFSEFVRMMSRWPVQLPARQMDRQTLFNCWIS